MNILAIETSCDETAAAVIESTEVQSNSSLVIGKKNNELPITNHSVLSTIILSNVVASQIDIHKKYGGVFPEVASRAHVEKIIPVVEEALSKSTEVQSNSSLVIGNKNKTNNELPITNNSVLNTIDLIAVTAGPGLIGSLLVGVNTAKTLAYANQKPIIPINHWLGHIYSCFTQENPKSELQMTNKMTELGIGNLDFCSSFGFRHSDLPQFPLLALIVSGGHTGIVYMKSHTEYETIGQTLDDAAGEAFDKVAKILELGYPGGPAIAAEAAKFKISNLKFKIDVKFPRSMLDRDDFNFSFSGLKTAVLYKVKELTKHYPLTAIRSQIAYEFQQTVIDILIGKTLKAAKKCQPKSILLCGGVSANKELRSQMAQQITQSFNHSITFHTPPMSLTGDNAAMIGIAAAYQLKAGVKHIYFEKIKADSNYKL